MAEDSQITHANDEMFEAMVINSDLPVLVDFWAPWCGPCQTIAPTVEALAKEYKGRANFVKVNVDEAQKTASSLGIMGIPTIILFNHGKPIDRRVGVQSKAVLNEMIAGALVETD